MSITLDAALLYDTAPVEDDDYREKRPQTADEPDSVLVARAGTGDFGAFEELVRGYRNDVFALAYHYVRDREEAWDLSQDVFLKVHRGLRRFRGDASFKTWVLRITANRCKDYFKKRRLRTVSIESSGGDEQRPAAGLQPDRAVGAQELGDAVAKALDGLPEKHRMAFVLREFEGLSYDEMAQVMKCNIGTVMSRLHHARKKLQKALIAMGAVEG